MYWIYLALTILTTTASVSTVAAQNVYHLSMLPNYSSEEINRRIRPLAKYLSQKTKSNIEAVITNDFAHYEKQLKNGSIDIGYEDPFIYTLVAESHEVIAMALMGRDQDKFRGIIIARKDAGLRSLEDLRGKKISIVGYTSASGYLSQKLSLMKAGVNIEKECNIVEAVGNKQENVILSVYTGDVAAGFIHEFALNKADNYIAPSQLMVISACAWLPNWALSVKKTLPKKFKKLIKIALLDLKPDHRVIKALKIERFRPAKDSEYDTIREASRK
jgi:phosphonate transport system substrate-binding protein